jgi:hypothetical protein
VPPTVSFKICPALGAIAGIGVKIVGTRTVSVVAVMVGKAALEASRIVPLKGWNIVFLFEIHVVHPIKRPAEDVILADPMASGTAVLLSVNTATTLRCARLLAAVKVAATPVVPVTRSLSERAALMPAHPLPPSVNPVPTAGIPLAAPVISDKPDTNAGCADSVAVAPDVRASAAVVGAVCNCPADLSNAVVVTPLISFIHMPVEVDADESVNVTVFAPPNELLNFQ